MRDPQDETFLLRRATVEDVEVLQAIVQEGFEGYRELAPAGWQPPDETTPEWHARSAEEIARRSTFAVLAEVDGEVAGHVRWVPAVWPSPDGSTPDAHLRHLFVRRAFWGAGVATALHDAAVADMRRRDVREARLFTPGWQARARRFYEREGWRHHYGPYWEPDLALQMVEYRLAP